jgi:hypothetical protein
MSRQAKPDRIVENEPMRTFASFSTMHYDAAARSSLARFSRIPSIKNTRP